MNVLQLMTAGLIWSGFLWPFVSTGQRIQRAPLGALPMQYNPSFAGEVGGPRLSTNFTFHPGSQAIPNHLYQSFTSYDQFISSISSGIGFTMGWSKFSQSDDNFYFRDRDYFLSASIAPKFSLKGKYTLSPSIEFTYQPTTTSSSYSIIPFSVSPNPLPAGGYKYSRHEWQTRIGFLLNTSKYYIGCAVNAWGRYAFLQRSQDTTISRAGSSNESQGFLSYLQAGYTFQRTSTSKFSFTPQVCLQIADRKDFYHNHRIDIEAIRLTFKYQQFLLGFNNRGGHLGWQTATWRIMASSQFNTYDLGGYEGNFSFRYLIKNVSDKSPV